MFCRLTARVTNILRQNAKAVIVLEHLTDIAGLHDDFRTTTSQSQLFAIVAGLVQTFHGCWNQAPAWLGTSKVPCHLATFLVEIEVCDTIGVVVAVQ